jgi:hypothetical protein
MIDPQTGTLSFEQPAVQVGPALTRGQFLSAAWGREGPDLTAKQPWYSRKFVGCKLPGQYLSASVSFAVWLTFEGRRLRGVELCNGDPAFGTSWDDYSEEKELLRKATHDEWLAASLGERRSFPWGTARSSYDRRGGGNTINLQYEPSAAGVVSFLRKVLRRGR